MSMTNMQIIQLNANQVVCAYISAQLIGCLHVAKVTNATNNVSVQMKWPIIFGSNSSASARHFQRKIDDNVKWVIFCVVNVFHIRHYDGDDEDDFGRNKNTRRNDDQNNIPTRTRLL